MKNPRWCVLITSDLAAADAKATALVTRLTREQLNWKPRPNAWSIAQCLEHLCMTNEIYIQPLQNALQAHPTGAVDDITPGWFGSWFIRKFIEPATQSARARAPRKIAPVSPSLDSSVVDRFIASNVQVRDVVLRAREFDVNRVRFRNPFLPLLRFTVGTGLLIIARHNHRHLLQAERVRQDPAFPG